MVDQTLSFLKQHEGTPCFVNLWLDDTHTPFIPSAAQLTAVPAADDAVGSKYRAVLTEADKQIGRLTDGLKGTNTLVIFLGDNGPSPPLERKRTGGLRGQKLSLYEGGIRVPFITWWPGKVPSGRVNETTVIATVDLLPTLAKICNARLPRDVAADGLDMTEALLGESLQRSKPLFWEYGRNATSFAYPKDVKHRSPNVAVREGKWKVLVNADGTGAELYDLSTDPAEKRDLAAEHPETAQRLAAGALKWRRSLPSIK